MSYGGDDGGGLLLNLTGGGEEEWRAAPAKRKRPAGNSALAARGRARQRRAAPADAHAAGAHAADGWAEPDAAPQRPRGRPDAPRARAEPHQRAERTTEPRELAAAVAPGLSARAVVDVFGPSGGHAGGAAGPAGGAPLAETFEALGLPEALVARLAALKYARPTRVQQHAIPALLLGRDVLVRSDTGSGKTLAYLLPAATQLITQQPRVCRTAGTAALVLAPTRELCIQILGCLQALLLPFHWVVPGAVMGGENRQKEKARLRRGITFLVATPGRLLDHLHSSEAFSIEPLRWLVLDEADRLLDLGFEAALTEILSHVQERARAPSRCTALLSATLPKSLEKLVHVALRNPLSVNLAADESAGGGGSQQEGAPAGSLSIPQQLEQKYVTVPCKLRLVALVAALRTWLCRGIQRIVVFASTCQGVEFYAHMLPQLEANGEPVLPCRIFKLHGLLPQAERMQQFRDFQSGETGILLCTDIAARGLDFPSVGAALQIDPPGLPEEYVHRIGRTARVGHKGEALLFLLPTEMPYQELLGSKGAHLGKQDLCALLGSLPMGSAAHRVGKAAMVAELHPASLMMMRRIEAVTSARADIRKAAKDAFRAHVRAYAAHPAASKAIFHVKRLHLGHLAANFGLKETPGLLGKSSAGPKASLKQKVQRAARCSCGMCHLSLRAACACAVCVAAAQEAVGAFEPVPGRLNSRCSTVFSWIAAAGWARTASEGTRRDVVLLLLVLTSLTPPRDACARQRIMSQRVCPSAVSKKRCQPGLLPQCWRVGASSPYVVACCRVQQGSPQQRARAPTKARNHERRAPASARAPCHSLAPPVVLFYYLHS
jgi:ATP-dependent RNA helicase DDX31/DBP7